MGNIVARVDKEGIVRYTNNPSTAQFAGMFIERCVSDRGVVAYYFLERKTRKNTGWSLSQQEYDQAMRVGAFIPVAQRKAVAQTVSASVPEPTYYQKSHDYATGRTVGQSRTSASQARQSQPQHKQATAETARKPQANQRVVMSRGNVPGTQMPDNTAGFSMSYASNSAFFKEDTPTFDIDVLQEKETEKKKGFFGRLFDGIKSFFVRPVVTPPTTMALPAPGETSSPDAPILNATPVITKKTAVVGRHYKAHQDAEVPVIPRGRG